MGERSTRASEAITVSLREGVKEVLEAVLQGTHTENDRDAILEKILDNVGARLPHNHELQEILQEGDLKRSNGQLNANAIYDAIKNEADRNGITTSAGSQLTCLASNAHSVFSTLRLFRRQS